MSDEPQNLVLEQLRLIREELALVSLKIGTLAEAQVGTNRRVDGLSGRVDSLSSRVDGLSDRIDSLSGDMRMVAIATDQHTARLDRVETLLSHTPIAH